MTSYEKWSLGITIFGLLVGSGVLIIYALQLKQMAQTTKAAKDAAEAASVQSKTSQEELHRSHRPWIAVSGDVRLLEPLTFDSSGPHMRISYSIKNAGSSPAIGVNTTAYFHVGLYPALVQQSMTEPVCDPRFTAVTQITGGFILPGEVYEIKGQEIRNPNPFQTAPDGRVSVFVKICIAYRDEFDVPHWTGLAWQYWISEKENAFIPKGIVHGSLGSVGLPASQNVK